MSAYNGNDSKCISAAVRGGRTSQNQLESRVESLIEHQLCRRCDGGHQAVSPGRPHAEYLQGRGAQSQNRGLTWPNLIKLFHSHSLILLLLILPPPLVLLYVPRSPLDCQQHLFPWWWTPVISRTLFMALTTSGCPKCLPIPTHV